MTVGCGNTPYIFTSNGQDIEITSPNYPRSTLTNLECSYLIAYPQNKVLRLEFLELEFKLNNYRIEIYDGNNTDADLVSSLKTKSKIKTVVPGPIFSKGNELLVRLKHGYESNGNGFNGNSKLTYRIKVESEGILAIISKFL